jgi:hypothetical protein
MRDLYDEKFKRLIQQAYENDMTYRYVLEEVKRDKQLIDPQQCESISAKLNVSFDRVIFYALDLNILDIDQKTKNVLLKEQKKLYKK